MILQIEIKPVLWPKSCQLALTSTPAGCGTEPYLQQVFTVGLAMYVTCLFLASLWVPGDTYVLLEVRIISLAAFYGN